MAKQGKKKGRKNPLQKVKKRVKIVLHVIAYQNMKALSTLLACLACLSRGFVARVAGQNTRTCSQAMHMREEMTDFSVL